MRIKYRAESMGIAKVCIVIGAVFVLIFPFDMIFNDFNLAGGYTFFGMVIAFMGVIIWFVKKSVDEFKAEREYIVNNGYECQGEVVDYIRKKHGDHYCTELRIKYYSRILEREITFDTPALDVSLEKKEGVYCTVYETQATERKKKSLEKVRSVFGLSGRLEGSDPNFEPDEISYMADYLENAEKYKAKPAEIIFITVFLLLFAAAAVWILKDNGIIK